MKNRLIDLVCDLRNVPDEISVWETTRRYFNGLQFDAVNYGVVNTSDKSVIGFFSNMNPEWMNYYIESGYDQSDPLIDHASRSQSDILIVKENRQRLATSNSENSEAMFNDLYDLGLRSALLSPFHIANGTVGAGVALWSNLKGQEFKKFVNEKRSEILVGAALVQSHLQWTSPALKGYSEWYPLQKNKLTCRECEVLQWLSIGLRTDRIADKMNIADVTVNYHLSSIKKKLDTKTREHAIAVAVSQGLIEL